MRRRWAPSDITSLVTRYTKEGPKKLAIELGRSVNAISSQARRYGQKTPRRAYSHADSTMSYEDLLGPQPQLSHS
ncbi:MAG: hypothetical protein JNJ77_06835 [Planctomycetia bacterium]|nr:hypothetical protein [Planctomycetia bacterium]